MLIPEANGKVGLCLHPGRLNKMLIRPVHRGQMLNFNLPRLVGVKFLTVIDVSSGYHDLKLDDKSSYLL